ELVLPLPGLSPVASASERPGPVDSRHVFLANKSKVEGAFGVEHRLATRSGQLPARPSRGKQRGRILVRLDHSAHPLPRVPGAVGASRSSVRTVRWTLGSPAW